jgi:hypothetical protein
MAQKWRFLTCHAVQRLKKQHGPAVVLSHFSLCLSRVCLGKTIGFVYQDNVIMRTETKKTENSSVSENVCTSHRDGEHDALRITILRKTHLFFEFSLRFVPSLSW